MIVCGVVGWSRKLERRKKKGQNQYMEAVETLEQRTKDKLLEKTNWYKTNQKIKAEDNESEFQYIPAMKKRKRVQGTRPTRRSWEQARARSMQ